MNQEHEQALQDIRIFVENRQELPNEYTVESITVDGLATYAFLKFPDRDDLVRVCTLLSETFYA